MLPSHVYLTALEISIFLQKLPSASSAPWDPSIEPHSSAAPATLGCQEKSLFPQVFA